MALKIEENHQLINKIVNEGIKKETSMVNKVMEATIELMSKNKNNNIEKIQIYTKNQIELINKTILKVQSEDIKDIIQYMCFKLTEKNNSNIEVVLYEENKNFDRKN